MKNLKSNLLSWLIALAVSLGVIAVIILSVLASKACAEIVVENRDGVIYVYNLKPEPRVVEATKESSEVIRWAQATNSQESEVEFKPRTKEEKYLIDAANSERDGYFRDATYSYDIAGDYDNAMRTGLQAAEWAAGEKYYADAARFYKKIGNEAKHNEMIILQAQETMGDGLFSSAAYWYIELWDHEKAKEMYLKQQQKVRNEIVDNDSGPDTTK